MIFFAFFGLTLFVLLALPVGLKNIKSVDEKIRLFSLAQNRGSLLAQLQLRNSQKGAEVVYYFLKRFLPKNIFVYYERGLKQTSIPLKGEEFVGLMVIFALASFFAGYMVSFGIGLILVIGVVGSFTFYLYREQQRRLKRFEAQLSDSLTVMINSLRAGFSFLQAMQSIAQEMPDPIGTEYDITLKEISMGMETKEALVRMTERIKSSDLDLIVTSILIQRQVGGNLGEILYTIQNTIAERLRIRGELKALTAQGKMSGYIVGALPIVLAIAMSIMKPGFLNVFVTTTIGKVLLAYMIGSMFFGFVIISKVTHIKF